MTDIYYLASPYSGPEAEMFDRHRWVCEAAALLATRGTLTYSPIAHSHAVAQVGGLSGSWEMWRDFDLSMIDRTDGLLVLMLPGWERSVGVEAEIRHARATNKSVQYLDVELGGGQVVLVRRAL